MSVSSTLQFKGIVEISVRDRQGRLLKRVVVENKIVDLGLELMSRLIVSPTLITNTTDDILGEPVHSIAVGVATYVDGTVLGTETTLGNQWARVPIQTAELLHASIDLVEDTTNTPVLTLRSRRHGAYGNKIQVTRGQINYSYGLSILDTNPDPAPSAWQPVGPFTPASIGGIAAYINANSPDVEAIAPDGSWAGNMAAAPNGGFLSGGGTGVVVSATFQNTGTTPVALTEAGLFTDSDTMFNRVRFPVINLSNGLDITFRWKILFQEPTP